MGTSALDDLRSIRNLRSVWDDYWRDTRGKSSAGVDWITPQAFRDDLDGRLRSIRDKLGQGYVFGDLRGIAIPKRDPAKHRLICIPTVADRIVQRALLRVIETRAQTIGILNSVSFGFVKDTGTIKRGTHGAHQAAVAHRKRAPWVFKAVSHLFSTTFNERGWRRNSAALSN